MVRREPGARLRGKLSHQLREPLGAAARAPLQTVFSRRVVVQGGCIRQPGKRADQQIALGGGCRLPLDGLMRSAQRVPPACFQADSASACSNSRDSERSVSGTP